MLWYYGCIFSSCNDFTFRSEPILLGYRWGRQLSQRIYSIAWIQICAGIVSVFIQASATPSGYNICCAWWCLHHLVCRDYVVNGKFVFGKKKKVQVHHFMRAACRHWRWRQTIQRDSEANQKNLQLLKHQWMESRELDVKFKYILLF